MTIATWWSDDRRIGHPAGRWRGRTAGMGFPGGRSLLVVACALTAPCVGRAG